MDGLGDLHPGRRRLLTALPLIAAGLSRDPLSAAFQLGGVALIVMMLLATTVVNRRAEEAALKADTAERN